MNFANKVNIHVYDNNYDYLKYEIRIVDLFTLEYPVP